MNINTTTHQVVKIETSSSKLKIRVEGESRGRCKESTFPTKKLKKSYIMKSHDNSYGIWSAARDWWLFKMVFLCHEHSSYPTSSFTAFKCYEHSNVFWVVLCNVVFLFDVHFFFVSSLFSTRAHFSCRMSSTWCCFMLFRSIQFSLSLLFHTFGCGKLNQMY